MLRSLARRCFHFWIGCTVVFACRPTKAVEETATNLPAQPTWGAISFSVTDAQIVGAAAKVEGKAGEQVITLAKKSDVVSWDYKPARWGMYDVEISYSAGGKSGSVWMEAGGKQLLTNYFSTGNTTLFTNLMVGRLYLEKAEPFTLRIHTVNAGTDSAGAFNLRGMRLIPAPEGNPIVQRGSEPVTLHASNAITHSVTMRYEPNEKKNCLGYWVNPKDWAEWKFTVTQPGAYEVELWQGCGKGQGGSEVDVIADDERFSFVAEETGHFQNFVPRQIGRVKFLQAGIHSIEVRPKSKHADAIMDIRQILLKPSKQP